MHPAANVNSPFAHDVRSYGNRLDSQPALKGECSAHQAQPARSNTIATMLALRQILYELQVYLEGFAVLQAQSGQGIADDDTQVLPLLKGCANTLCIAPATSTHTNILSLLLM